MVPANELRLDDLRDIGEALVMQLAVSVFLALLVELLIGPQLSSLLVLGLQFV